MQPRRETSLKSAEHPGWAVYPIMIMHETIFSRMLKLNLWAHTTLAIIASGLMIVPRKFYNEGLTWMFRGIDVHSSMTGRLYWAVMLLLLTCISLVAFGLIITLPVSVVYDRSRNLMFKISFVSISIVFFALAVCLHIYLTK
jgi:hypothetical protein